MEPTEKKSYGALIGSIIIIIIIIIGGIYVWQSKVKNLEKTNPTNQPATGTVTTTGATSADLNDLNSLDQEANATDSDAGVDVNNIQ